jgi:hypothetical protein
MVAESNNPDLTCDLWYRQARAIFSDMINFVLILALSLSSFNCSLSVKLSSSLIPFYACQPQKVSICLLMASARVVAILA